MKLNKINDNNDKIYKILERIEERDLSKRKTRSEWVAKEINKRWKIPITILKLYSTVFVIYKYEKTIEWLSLSKGQNYIELKILFYFLSFLMLIYSIYFIYFKKPFEKLINTNSKDLSYSYVENFLMDKITEKNEHECNEDYEDDDEEYDDEDD
ncbi:MAG: hypothetical protein AM1032_000149 [Mycoplasmataceae bacterium]|nr:MAG: hypothetical protein AM1032_000149 [Mycoplasmataceae bacterium]